MAERDEIRKLAACVGAGHVRAFLLGVAYALREQLRAAPDSLSTQPPLPLGLYVGGLPADIRSSWVFILREGTSFPAERHPNSIQRMFALEPAGAMEVWTDGAWRRHDLDPADSGTGLSIPAMTWHRPALADCDWAVVSFHTVEAADLVEQIGDPQGEEISSSRHYHHGVSPA